VPEEDRKDIARHRLASALGFDPFPCSSEPLPLTDAGTLFAREGFAAFRDAADPHLTERLETETFRVVERLSKLFRTLQSPQESDRELELRRRPLSKSNMVAVILDGRTEPRRLSAEGLSSRDRRDPTTDGVTASAVDGQSFIRSDEVKGVTRVAHPRAIDNGGSSANSGGRSVFDDV